MDDHLPAASSVRAWPRPLAFALTPKYRAEVVFSPADSSGELRRGSGRRQLGGLAALAGINLGGSGKKSDEMLEYLRSRGNLRREFIQRHALMPVLFAKRGMRSAGSGATRCRRRSPRQSRNSANQVRQIAEDRRTGIVTVAIIWSDRVAAAQWANALIAEADDALRQRAIAELRRSIDYLKAEAPGRRSWRCAAAVYKPWRRS